MGLRTFLWRRVGAYPATIRGERFVCHPAHRAQWRKMAGGKWAEAGALDVLDRSLSPRILMWDIGANIGQYALYASRKCRRVVCFEPDAAILRYLHWNIARNRADNVTVVGAALAAETGFRRMGSFESGGKLGKSMTSFYASTSAECMTAPCLGRETWGEWLCAEPPDFVKMDIEGGEFELLPAMSGWLAEKRPRLMLSLHGVPLLEAGRMSESEMKKALEECADILSFYGEFLDLRTGDKFPMTEFVARMSAVDLYTMDGVFLE